MTSITRNFISCNSIRRNWTALSCQYIQIRGIRSKAVSYTSFGNPIEVLQISNEDVPECTPDQVQLKILAAPINPADINQIQGTYPSKPKDVPGIGYVAGNECVAQVVQVGSNVRDVSVGDWVIPGKAGVFGAWRKYVNCSHEDIVKLSKEGISVINASTISVNPCTAYRMLNDFVDLKPGDVVVQNGANSGVGQAVIQLAKAKGVHTVNIIRNRPNVEELAQYLKSLGATEVLTEDEVRKPSTTKLLQSLGPQPRLALNCVGGKSATNMARLLGQDAYLVTYGGMSKEPVTLPTSLFIFKNLHATGFWMTEWNKRHAKPERQAMLDSILDLMRQGKFVEPHAEISKLDMDGGMSDTELEGVMRNAIEKATSGFAKGKQILMFE